MKVTLANGASCILLGSKLYDYCICSFGYWCYLYISYMVKYAPIVFVCLAICDLIYFYWIKGLHIYIYIYKQIICSFFCWWKVIFSLKNLFSIILRYLDFYFYFRFLIQVRIFKPGNVNETLKKSLKDYVQASVGISNKGKLLVPKFLYCFAKGIVEDSLLPEWICQFLSPEQAAVVRDCSSNPKRRLLSARSFSILSFDSRFRYLFLLEDRTLPKRHGVNGND